MNANTLHRLTRWMLHEQPERLPLEHKAQVDLAWAADEIARLRTVIIAIDRALVPMDATWPRADSGGIMSDETEKLKFEIDDLVQSLKAMVDAYENPTNYHAYRAIVERAKELLVCYTDISI